MDLVETYVNVGHFYGLYGLTMSSRTDASKGPLKDPLGFLRGYGGTPQGARDEEVLSQALERYEMQVRLFDGVVSTTPDFVYLFDLQGRVLYANRRLLEVWGMELDDVVGKTCLELGYEQWHHDLHMGEIGQVVETRRPLKGEVPFTAPVTGIFGVYEYIFTPVLGPDGAVEFVAGTTRDVTERKRAEEEIRYRGEQFQTLLNQAPMGVYLINADFRIAQVNPVAMPVFGGLADLIGRDFDEVLHILWEEPYADEVGRIFRHTLETGESYHTPQRAQLRADRRVTEYYEWRIDRITLPDGRYGVVCYFRDISEQVRGRQAIAQSEARYRALFNSIDEGFCILQLLFDEAQQPVDYRYIEINEVFEQQTGMTGALGKTIRELVPGIEPFWFDIYGKVALTGEPTRFADHAESMGRWFDVYAFRIGYPEERKVAVLFRDITARKQTEEALRHSEERLRESAERLEQLVHARTKELVQSQKQLRALATELNLAEQRERNRLAADLHDHLQQLLVLGKLKLRQGLRLAGPGPACAEFIQETDEVLAEALRYTRTLVAELSPPVLREHGLFAGLKWLGEYMKRHDMTVVVDLPGTPPPTLPEEQAVLLFQSVRELLINAWKHGRTGEAFVRLEDTSGLLRIEVRDEGVGCPDPDPAEGAAMELSNGGSSKFGLFSIHERMTALGGSFEWQSVQGKGTRAALVLPLARAAVDRVVRGAMDQPPSSLPPSVLSVPGGGGSRPERLRVLLVDDHAMVRQGLKTVLDGYPDVEVVGEAGDGVEALALADRLRPAVVVMDINMPRMNGIEATRTITSHYRDTTVVGLSVNASRENHEAMKAAGAVVLITKEAAVEQLYSAIRQAH
jgi:PAS domain S-box-containing protein